jgi:hypothetical protein
MQGGKKNKQDKEAAAQLEPLKTFFLQVRA